MSQIDAKNQLLKSVIGTPLIDSKANEESSQKQKSFLSTVQILLIGWVMRFPHIKLQSAKGLTIKSPPNLIPAFLILERELFEHRSTEKITVPYDGKPLSPYTHTHDEFQPWDYQPIDRRYRNNSINFKNDSFLLEVSGSHVAKKCHECGASGKVSCPKCNATKILTCPKCKNGEVNCSNCGGSGSIDNYVTTTEWKECPSCRIRSLSPDSYSGECPQCLGRTLVQVSKSVNHPLTCQQCAGSGTEECATCNGTSRVTCKNCDQNGQTTCTVCEGRKKLLTYLALHCSRRPKLKISMVSPNDVALKNHRLLTSEFATRIDQNLVCDLENIFFLDDKVTALYTSPTNWFEQQGAFSKIHSIEDQTALDDFFSVGVNHATLAVLLIVPLIYLANADGYVDKKEKAWLEAFCKLDNEDRGAAFSLATMRWLDSPRLTGLFYIWSLTVFQLRLLCSEQGMNYLRKAILAASKKLAECSGEELFAEKISSAEKFAMQVINNIFQGDISFADKFLLDIPCDKRDKHNAPLDPALKQIGVYDVEANCVRKSVQVVRDQFFAISYQCSGYGLNVDGSDTLLDSSIHEAVVSRGMSFVFPHQSPALIVSKHLAKDALDCLARGKPKFARDSTKMMKEIGKYDPYSYIEFQSLLKKIPSDVKDAVEDPVGINYLYVGLFGFSVLSIIISFVLLSATGSVIFFLIGFVIAVACVAFALFKMQSGR